MKNKHQTQESKKINCFSFHGGIKDMGYLFRDEAPAGICRNRLRGVVQEFQDLKTTKLKI